MATRWTRFWVLVSIIALVATACGGDDDQGGEGARDIDRSASLTFAWPAPPQTLDPHNVANAVAATPYQLPVFDRLMLLTVENTLEPMLATDWELSEDGLTLDVTLREGVTFHDGTPIDAEAVKANLERAQAGTRGGELDIIETIEVVDATHLRMNLGSHGATLPFALATTAGAIMSPAGFDAPDIDEDPIGSGPYRAVEVRQDRIVYERVDDYWDSENAAFVQRLIIVGLPDHGARLNGVRTGEYDITYVLPSQSPQVESLTESDEFDTHLYVSNAAYTVFMNRNVPPLDNSEVVRALSLAIDRDAINQALCAGRQCPPTVQPWPRDGAVGHLDDVEPAYDPEEARSILETEGATDLSISLLQIAGISPSDQMTEAVAEQWEQDLGISVELTALPPTEARPAWQRGEFDAHIGFSQPGPDPSLFAEYFMPNPGDPPSDLVEMNEPARRLPIGSDERHEAYQEIAEYLVENPIHIPVGQYSTWLLYSSGVRNVENIPGFPNSGVFDPRFLAKAVNGHE